MSRSANVRGALREVAVGVACLAAVGAGILVSCGEEDAQRYSSVGGALGAPSAAEAQDLSSWVTFANFVAVVTVEAEIAQPASEVPDRPEAMVGRAVRMSIDQVLWDSGAGPVPEEAASMTPGWREQVDGDPRPLDSMDGIRLEVGGTYVMPLWRATFADKYSVWFLEEWGDLPIYGTESHAAILEVAEDGTLSSDESDGDGGDLDGLTIAQLSERLASTEPEPDVVALQEGNPGLRGFELMTAMIEAETAEVESSSTTRPPASAPVSVDN